MKNKMPSELTPSISNEIFRSDVSLAENKSNNFQIDQN